MFADHTDVLDRRRHDQRAELKLSTLAHYPGRITAGQVSGVEALDQIPGVIAPFPGGIAGSGSKAGSSYPFLFASTNHPYCPTLRSTLGGHSQVSEGVNSIMEIIINGRDLKTVCRATQAVIKATVDSPGLSRISAGNYGGRLGKSFVYLHPEHQPAE